ncbi:hypothetical protein [Chondrinema litorale]|uniref:hypothetical protein n=1 Tax=Chondrinema litorale TaxID=2994555 RepID=UPI00254309AE|nr:hypothetical protein [Chondrinema litorale]UZR93142.1 hypothetical protein OQ292_14880 [Chondrinema litorale]
MSLLSIEFYNSGGTVKTMEWGVTRKDMMVINPAAVNVTFRCTMVVTVDGEKLTTDKQEDLMVTNSMQVPVVNTSLEPVMVDNPDFDESKEVAEDNPVQIQKTIGEWDMWLDEFYYNTPRISLQEAITNAIKRKLVQKYAASFPELQDFVYIQRS